MPETGSYVFSVNIAFGAGGADGVEDCSEGEAVAAADLRLRDFGEGLERAYFVVMRA